MKIVCAYFDPPGTFLSTDPTDKLKEHEITVVHTFVALKALFVNPLEYNIVLTDVTLPHNDSIQNHSPTIVLEYIFRQALVRGIGFLLPTYYSDQYQTNDEFTGIVTSKECWTPQGFRDWEKLLNLVITQIP